MNAMLSALALSLWIDHRRQIAHTLPHIQRMAQPIKTDEASEVPVRDIAAASKAARPDPGYWKFIQR